MVAATVRAVHAAPSLVMLQMEGEKRTGYGAAAAARKERLSRRRRSWKWSNGHDLLNGHLIHVSLLVLVQLSFYSDSDIKSSLLRGGGGGVVVVGAAPIGPPNLRQCDSTSGCCLPSPNPAPTAFVKNTSIPFHTRQALHTALQNAEFLRKLSSAYAVIRSLPATDPRSLENQRRSHCAFCTPPRAYGENFNVHGNWFFLPWHRMYLYYHERILAWASRDAAFALPFWNWDSDAGRPFPTAYTNRSSSLYTRNRRAAAELRSLMLESTSKTVVRESVLNMWRVSDFFGGLIDADPREPGSAETRSHNGVHIAVGNNGPDMGTFEMAGLDPIFYNHHCNVDRLWFLWLRMPRTPIGARANPSSSDWRNSKYTFYDEQAKAKIIAVSDVLDHKTNLRYTYQDVNNDWLNANELPGPARRRRSSRRLLLLQTENSQSTNALDLPREVMVGGTFPSGGKTRGLRNMQPLSSSHTHVRKRRLGRRRRRRSFVERSLAASSTGPISTTGAPISVNLQPPPPPSPLLQASPARGSGASASPQSRPKVPLIAFDGLEFPGNAPFALHVFINQPGADLSTQRQGNPHYVTSIFSVRGRTSTQTLTVTASLIGALRANGLTELVNITLNVVPQGENFQPTSARCRSIAYERFTGP